MIRPDSRRRARTNRHGRPPGPVLEGRRALARASTSTGIRTDHRWGSVVVNHRPARAPQRRRPRDPRGAAAGHRRRRETPAASCWCSPVPGARICAGPTMTEVRVRRFLRRPAQCADGLTELPAVDDRSVEVPPGGRHPAGGGVRSAGWPRPSPLRHPRRPPRAHGGPWTVSGWCAVRRRPGPGPSSWPPPPTRARTPPAWGSCSLARSTTPSSGHPPSRPWRRCRSPATSWCWRTPTTTAAIAEALAAWHSADALSKVQGVPREAQTLGSPATESRTRVRSVSHIAFQPRQYFCQMFGGSRPVDVLR